jgi:hypothetical protein
LFRSKSILSQSHSTFELHKRVLVDLDQREATVLKQEAEARRVLEQALAHCAAERTSIEQDRAVMVQAEKLYRRFLDETDEGGVPEDNAAQREEPSAREEFAAGEPSGPQESGPREPSVMELRRLLWNENQMDGMKQREAWAADQPPPGAPVGSYS